MEQLLCHILGDFLFQSDWMAMNKSKRSIPCLVHVLIYTSVFLLFTTSWKALLVIGGVHFILDRFPIIIRRLIWIKNHVGPTLKYPKFTQCNSTGYYDDSPYNTDTRNKFMEGGPSPAISTGRSLQTLSGITRRHFFITIWLYIITDNFLHLLTNYLALKYLT